MVTKVFESPLGLSSFKIHLNPFKEFFTDDCRGLRSEQHLRVQNNKPVCQVNISCQQATVA